MAGQVLDTQTATQEVNPQGAAGHARRQAHPQTAGGHPVGRGGDDKASRAVTHSLGRLRTIVAIYHDVADMLEPEEDILAPGQPGPSLTPGSLLT